MSPTMPLRLFAERMRELNSVSFEEAEMKVLSCFISSAKFRCIDTSMPIAPMITSHCEISASALTAF